MKVLLISDIGSNKAGYYHVGDEAMYYETYRWYINHVSDADITAFTRSVDKSLPFAQIKHIAWPLETYHARTYFIKIVLKSIFWRLGKKIAMTEEEIKFISTISNQDIIHFSGGGNIYSLYRPWLYYVLAVIAIGRIFNKPIYLINQTIGPLRGLDWLFAAIILNFVKVIAIREVINSPLPLLQYGLIFPKVKSMIDLTYTLPSSSKINLPHKNKLRIGLSLHELSKHSNDLLSSIRTALAKIGEGDNYELILIPHILANDLNSYDLGFMKKLVGQTNIKKHLNQIPLKKIIKNKHAFVDIRYLTSQVDLLITTRYHGTVFALSQNIPCIAVIEDSYNKRKHIHALKFVYGTKSADYLINLNDKNQQEKIIQLMKDIMANLDGEKQYLQNRNKKLQSNQQLFKLNNLLTLFAIRHLQIFSPAS